MSVVRHENSPYWYASFMIDGKSVFKSTKCTNKTKALQIEAELKQRMLDDRHFANQEFISLKEIIGIYLDSRKGQKTYKRDCVYGRKILGQRIDPKTRMPVQVYGLNGEMSFHEIKTKDLFRLWMGRQAEGIKAATFLHELLFIGGLIKTARQLGYAIPSIDIKNFKKEQKIRESKGKLRYLSFEEEGRLLNELHLSTSVRGVSNKSDSSDGRRLSRQNLYDLMVLLLDTGARHTEISAIPWSAIKLEKGVIELYRGKVNKESIIPMTKRVKEILVRRLKNRGDQDEFVFVDSSGSGVRKYNPQAFNSACRRAKIDGVTFHTLRHTTASRLAQAGLPLADVQQLLGHSSIMMTMRYSHLHPENSCSNAIAVLNKLPNAA